MQDETVKSKLANAKKLSEVVAKDYDAIFYIGGHGPVFDLAFDPLNAELVSEVSRLAQLRGYLITERNLTNVRFSSGKTTRLYPQCVMDQRRLLSKVPPWAY